MTGSMFYVSRRSQLPAFVPEVISSFFPTTTSSTPADPHSHPHLPPSSSMATDTLISHKASSQSPERSSIDSAQRPSGSIASSCNNSRFPPALCFPAIPPSAEIKAWKSQSDHAAKTLQNLLRATHSTFALIQPCPISDSYSAAGVTENLCAAYLLGASASHLRNIFDSSIDRLQPWSDSPAEVSIDDWQDFLGDVSYQRAYLDFFEDQLVEYGYDWRCVVLDYMFRVDQPLVTGVTGSWGAALIRLGLAYELDSSLLAMESLAIAACMYSRPQSRAQDSPQSSSGASQVDQFESPDIQKVLASVATDSRLKGCPSAKNVGFEAIIQHNEVIFADYENAWDLSRQSSDLAVEQRFERGHKIVAAAFVGSIVGGQSCSYSIPLANAVVLSHAVRAMIPAVPTIWQAELVCAWWRVVLAAYISAGCPPVESHLELTGLDVTANGHDWETVRKTFASSPGASPNGAYNDDDDASELVDTVVAASAESGGRSIEGTSDKTRKPAAVNYEALMKQMYEARCRRAEREEAAEAAGGASTGVDPSVDPNPAQEHPPPGAVSVDVPRQTPLWAEAPLVAAAWSLMMSSSSSDAVHDKNGVKLFDALARRAVQILSAES